MEWDVGVGWPLGREATLDKMIREASLKRWHLSQDLYNEKELVMGRSGEDC